MRHSIEVRVRIPVADIVDAMADEVSREVERQVAPIFKLPRPTPEPRRPVLGNEDYVTEVISAVTRLENSTHTRDEPAAWQALRKAALALRAAQKQSKKDQMNA